MTIDICVLDFVVVIENENAPGSPASMAIAKTHSRIYREPQAKTKIINSGGKNSISFGYVRSLKQKSNSSDGENPCLELSEIFRKSEHESIKPDLSKALVDVACKVKNLKSATTPVQSATISKAKKIPALV